MAEAKLSSISLIEGRVTRHPTNPRAIQVDSGQHWYTVPAGWRVPEEGVFIRMHIDAKNRVVGIRVRGPFRDRLIRQVERQGITP